MRAAPAGQPRHRARAAPAPAAMLSAFLAGACLSDGWLMNRGCSYLRERGIACFTHGPNWESLVRSMCQIHKMTFPKIAAIFTDLSPATLLSPGNTTTNPGIPFWGRETGRTNTTLLLTNFYDMKHKVQTCFTSTLTLKVSCTISSRKITILQKNTTEISVLMPEDPYMRCLTAYLASLCLGGTRNPNKRQNITSQDDQTVASSHIVPLQVHQYKFWSFHISTPAAVQCVTEPVSEGTSLPRILLDLLNLLPNFSWQPIIFSSMLYLADT